MATVFSSLLKGPRTSIGRRLALLRGNKGGEKESKVPEVDSPWYGSATTFASAFFSVELGVIARMMTLEGKPLVVRHSSDKAYAEFITTSGHLAGTVTVYGTGGLPKTMVVTGYVGGFDTSLFRIFSESPHNLRVDIS